MKLNITKGEAKVDGDCIVINDEIVADCFEGNGLSAEEREANITIIAEAFNVANETGLTPRELWERLSAANKLLREHRLIQAI